MGPDGDMVTVGVGTILENVNYQYHISIVVETCVFIKVSSYYIF